MDDMATIKHVVMQMDGRSSHWRRILNGIVTYVRTHRRWRCTIFSETSHGLADFVRTHAVDGLIINNFDTDFFAAAAHRKCMVVNVSALHESLSCPQVIPDNVAAGGLAAEHLLSTSLNTMAFYGQQDCYYSDLREKGFRKALDRHGVKCLTFPLPPSPPNLRQEELDSLSREWLRSLPKPIGILACNDYHALRLNELCEELGIRVPEDVALLGVDNDDFYCELSRPPLSSLDLGSDRIGYAAAELLDSLFQGAKPPRSPRLIVPEGVVRRQSTDLLALSDPEVVETLRFIRDHAHEGIRMKNILRVIPLSRKTIETRFKKAIGRTPVAEIRRLQLDRSKQILLETDQPMPSVARQSGFLNAKEFSKTFRKQVGMTPSQYRMQMRMR